MQNFVFSKIMIANILKVRVTSTVMLTRIAVSISKSFLKVTLGVGIAGKKETIQPNIRNNSDVISKREIDAVNV